MYLQNKYTRWYYQIIDRARTRSTQGYVERHHIIPRSLGGPDTRDNLVDLTAREHYICHLLLTHMTQGRSRNSMLYAVKNMRHFKHQGHQRDFPVNSYLYESMRIQHQAMVSRRSRELYSPGGPKHAEITARNRAKANDPAISAKISQALTGHTKSAEHRLKLSQAAQNRPPISAETRAKLSQASRQRWQDPDFHARMCQTHQGRPKTAEHRAKIGDSHRGKIMSDETKAKLSAAQKGKPGTWVGRHHSQESKEKIRQAALARSHRSKNNPPK